MYNILYGQGETFIDVTDTVIKKRIYTIPRGDGARSELFGIDPVPGVLKVIRILWSNGSFDDYADNITIHIEDDFHRDSQPLPPSDSVESEIQAIHRTLQLVHGSLNDEYPEQLMSMRFIGPRRTSTLGILEIGGNVGRNSCTIAALLGREDSHKLVVVEPGLLIAQQLEENRDANGLRFHIVKAAISRVPLMHRDWDTRPIGDSGVPDEEWTRVETICWTDLHDKWAAHGLHFDTLVADCEGALYYILKEEPEFLQGISLVLIENDFTDMDHKRFVDSEFERNGLQCVHREAGGWGPCYDRFYEAWAK